MIGNTSRYNGDVNVQVYQKKASTAINFGDILVIDGNGFVLPANATSAADDIVGVAMRTVASTDADYASATDIAVDTFRKGNRGDWFVLLVGTGTPAQTMVGELHDLTAAGKADLSAAAIGVYRVERIIDSTHVIVSMQDTDGT